MPSSIEWTDHTINPGLYGCQAISPACAHCYAAPMAARLERMGAPGYRDGANATAKGWAGKVRVDYDRIGPAFAKLPKKKPCRVFLTSMADLFHADVPFSFIALVFGEMLRRPHITFQVLTKRPQRAVDFWEYCKSEAGWEETTWPANVWMGCTVEDQQRADERIPHLLRIPAGVIFLSMEPLLGPVDLGRVVSDGVCAIDALEGTCGWPLPHEPHPYGKIGWVIAGGESGRHARPSHPDWFRSLRDQCAEAQVPFLFKQWGEWAPAASLPRGGVALNPDGSSASGEAATQQPRCRWLGRVGKKAAGRLLDGQEHNAFPEAPR